MENINTKLLLEKIQHLADKTDVGFKNICTRLDISNGRMTKGEAKSDENKSAIVALEKQDIKHGERIKTSKLFWITMTTLITAVGTLLGIVFSCRLF